jgi:hypothetical protein
MSRFKVTIGHYTGDSRVQEVIFFDAESFELLDYRSGPVALFTNEDGENIGAVDGFDYVELVDEPESKDPEERVDDVSWIDIPGQRHKIAA